MMTSRQFVVAVVTSLVVVQLVAGRHLVPAVRTDGTVGRCRLLLLLREPSWPPVKRSSSTDSHIRRLWLSRGSTSSLMNQRLRQRLLDSNDDVDLLGDHVT